VIAAWKQQEALKLAQAEAKKIAEQAGKAADLKSLDLKKELIVTPPSFSWYTVGVTQFAGPSLSQVPGIELAGNEFFQSVFDLQVGEAGIALDQPHKTVYAVKVLAEEGISPEDRERFLEKGTDPQLVDAAWQSQLLLQSELYNELFKQYNVTWAPLKEGESDE
jgi:hypothetical protein